MAEYSFDDVMEAVEIAHESGELSENLSGMFDGKNVLSILIAVGCVLGGIEAKAAGMDRDIILKIVEAGMNARLAKEKIDKSSMN